jgi:hypothetical protein
MVVQLNEQNGEPNPLGDSISFYTSNDYDADNDRYGSGKEDNDDDNDDKDKTVFIGNTERRRDK